MTRAAAKTSVVMFAAVFVDVVMSLAGHWLAAVIAGLVALVCAAVLWRLMP
jgi:hypothetical protein